MSDRERGGVSVYIHKIFEFKTRPDLSVTSKDIKAITVKMVSNKNAKYFDQYIVLTTIW